ncbi:MAG: hypothetical protein CL823_02350 [Crocinitomicaceae bacterium]|nr:hypothetical protein [Crocinitomicaceae bacterium]
MYKTDMKYRYLFILIFLPLLTYGQSVKRAVLCSYGGSTTTSENYLSFSFGQPSNIGTVSDEVNYIRQGFEQPLGCVGGPIEFTQDLAICDGASVTVGSSVYTAAGSYTDTFTNEFGCDSTVTTVLLVNPLTTSSTSEVSCDDFAWNGTTYSESGEYTYITIDQNGCDSTATLNLTVSDLSLSADLIEPSCYDSEDGAIDLTYTSNAMPVDIMWSNGLMFEDNLNIPAGEYTVTITDANDCEQSETFNLSSPQELYLALSTMDASCDYILDGMIESDLLGGTSPYQFSWSTGSTEEMITEVGIGDYTLTVTDANDCEVSAEATVDYLGEGCLEIPDVFTPNDDGYNDEWVINGIIDYPDARVQVYNRWGQLLYESIGYTYPWDGVYEGEALPIADYYYIIDLQDGTEARTGTITLKR